MVIWITGLAGAGKTTLGAEVCKQLRARNHPVVFLDGDDLREILGNDLGHNPSDRLANAKRLGRMCLFLARQNVTVVCTTMSLFEECHRWNREHLPGYFEVYLEASLDLLVQRDKKQLYSRALKGEIQNVVGVDLEFSAPKNADVHINAMIPLDKIPGLANKILNQFFSNEKK